MAAKEQRTEAVGAVQLVVFSTRDAGTGGRLNLFCECLARSIADPIHAPVHYQEPALPTFCLLVLHVEEVDCLQVCGEYMHVCTRVSYVGNAISHAVNILLSEIE